MEPGRFIEMTKLDFFDVTPMLCFLCLRYYYLYYFQYHVTINFRRIFQETEEHSWVYLLNIHGRQCLHYFLVDSDYFNQVLVSSATTKHSSLKYLDHLRN